MARFFSVLLLLSLPFGNPSKEKIVEENRPYTYDILNRDLADLHERYKQVIQIKCIGTTYLHKKIWAIKLGTGEKNIVLVGTHHAREWLTSMLLMKMLETYAKDYQEEKKVTNILNEVSIWFVPMLNPDGVDIQQNKFHHFSALDVNHLIRMNDGSFYFHSWKANGVGIDLNRQYPAGWEELDVEPDVPFSKFYKGKAPLEAKEIIALTQFIEKTQPSAAVAYHTAGREIYWKYKNGKYLKRDKRIAKKISKLTGYKLGEPGEKAVGGGLTDWFITTYHRPAMTIEISYFVGETNPPLSVFKTEWRRNKLVGLKLAEEAIKIKK